LTYKFASFNKKTSAFGPMFFCPAGVKIYAAILMGISIGAEDLIK